MEKDYVPYPKDNPITGWTNRDPVQRNTNKEGYTLNEKRGTGTNYRNWLSFRNNRQEDKEPKETTEDIADDAVRPIHGTMERRRRDEGKKK